MKTRNLIIVSMFAALTAVSAQITVPLPFTPIPITLQVLAVFLSGAILGSRFGALSQIIYLLLGAIGVPVFAGLSGGFQILVGIHGGYLLSYPIASYIIGKITEMYKKDNITVLTILNSIAMITGLIVIYLMGTTQFSLLTGNSFLTSIKLTVIPFIIADLIKLIITVPLAISIKYALIKSNLITA